jgi:SWI/SNF-related matrix-associated actin-dependent regulator of chromatin subfamily A protein 2/4
VILFIPFAFSIISKPYVAKLKDEQHTYVPKVLDEYLRNNVQETKQDYMYRDDLSGFSKKKNAEIISGKFVYDTNNDESNNSNKDSGNNDSENIPLNPDNSSNNNNESNQDDSSDNNGNSTLETPNDNENVSEEEKGDSSEKES